VIFHSYVSLPESIYICTYAYYIYIYTHTYYRLMMFHAEKKFFGFLGVYQKAYLRPLENPSFHWLRACQNGREAMFGDSHPLLHGYNVTVNGYI
jgi:hypothetical protein